MPRPSRNPGPRFSFAELAVAGDMTRRAVQHVIETGLLPPGGDIRTLKRMATIGGFAAAGVPLLCAAKIAAAILVEFNESDGEAPSGLRFIVRELSDDEVSAVRENGDANDYWYHLALYKHRKKLGLSESLGKTRFDAFIEIIDREFVFMSAANNLLILDGVTHRPQEAQFIGWLEGWERASDARLVPLYEKIHIDGCATADRPDNTGAELVNAALDARLNAVGTIRVNVSLAIRQALDRVAEYRANHGRAKAMV
jgi:hypothetical protein